ncbi:unnamed protein product [Dovyalis caffra]|uniref:Uncharacterized protein n=1 Tax=Dovyalis caffra TaxID=77055 RepID=A0AAV1R002_9ROSI|nr:unnamed protein product [Dovyalis caffra]
MADAVHPTWISRLEEACTECRARRYYVLGRLVEAYMWEPLVAHERGALSRMKGGELRRARRARSGRVLPAWSACACKCAAGEACKCASYHTLGRPVEVPLYARGTRLRRAIGVGGPACMDRGLGRG